jgi:hypothetical protein
MKTGRSLQQIAGELERQLATRRDYVAPTSALLMETEPTGHDAQPDTLRLGGLNGDRYGITEYAHAQIAEETGIPKPYYDRVRGAAPALLADHVNHWWRAEPKRRMVRTLDGDVRAFLSDRYRRLDNFDLAETVLPVLQGLGCEVRSAELTDRRLYIKATLPALQLPVAGSRRVGDVAEAGITISNSEVGAGAVNVDPFALLLACLNGMTRADASMRRYHVGRRQGNGGNGEEGESVRELLSAEAVRADDRAFWLKVRDVVRGAFRREVFERWVAKMSAAAGDRIEAEDPARVVDVTATRLALSERARGNVLRHLIEGGDLSRWGLVNAVTRSAEDEDDYETATELERAGGTILELPASEWRAISAATAAA